MKKTLSVLCMLVVLLCFYSCATVQPEDDLVVLDATMISTTKNTTFSENQDAIDAFQRGGMLMTAGDFQAAEPELRAAISFDPEFVDAYDYLGIVLRRLGKTDEAITILKKSISIQPDNHVPYSSLCIAYMDKGNEKLALQTCEEAIKNCPEPDCADAYFNEGCIIMNQGNYSLAAKYLQKAYDLWNSVGETSKYDAAASLGLCCYALQDWSNAEKYLKLSLAKYPDDPDLLEFYESAKQLNSR